MISTTTITGKTGGGYKCESGTCPHGVGPDSLWRMRGELISSPSFSYDFFVEGLIRKYQDMLELYARSLLCPYASPERSHVQTKDFHAINR